MHLTFEWRFRHLQFTIRITSSGWVAWHCVVLVNSYNTSFKEASLKLKQSCPTAALTHCTLSSAFSQSVNCRWTIVSKKRTQSCENDLGSTTTNELQSLRSEFCRIWRIVSKTWFLRPPWLSFGKPLWLDYMLAHCWISEQKSVFDNISSPDLLIASSSFNITGKFEKTPFLDAEASLNHENTRYTMIDVSWEKKSRNFQNIRGKISKGDLFENCYEDGIGLSYKH